MAETVTPLPAGGPQFRAPEAIASTHDLSSFNCSREELDVWLKKKALTSEGKTARTYVVAYGNRVVGYYTLASGGVGRETIPKPLQRSTPKEIPLVVLGRLATDRNFEGRGIGSGMLQEAIGRMLNGATEIGIRGLLVHAIDDVAAGFYRKFGFIDCPIGERTLLLPVETAQQALLLATK